MGSRTKTPLMLYQLCFYIKMQLRGSDTFFPTKFRPATANPNTTNGKSNNFGTKSFKLVKMRSTTQEPQTINISDTQPKNIFKSSYIQESTFNYSKDRPIGGVQAFLKEQTRKNKVGSSYRLPYRPSTNGPKSKLQSNNGLRDWDSKLIIENDAVINEQVERETKQEIFKSHDDYNPQKSKLKCTTQNNWTNIRPDSKSSKLSKVAQNNQHSSWVKKQTQNFHNKMSVLNEVYYMKPLVQKYGDRYFEFVLRNRFQEDLPPPAYIHQICSQTQAIEANGDKFLSKVKQLHPNIKNFQKLSIRGKKFTNPSQMQDHYQN